MQVLGIDYGERHIGVAVGDTDTGLSQPLTTIDASPSSEDLLRTLQELIVQHQVEHIVIGISENQSAESAQRFSQMLGNSVRPSVSLVDETLSSQESASALRTAPKKKRRTLGHAASAAIILERWLDDVHETNIDYSAPDTV